ncbi:MAG: heparin lyase I family protein [Bacteroidota bacterium]
MLFRRCLICHTIGIWLIAACAAGCQTKSEPDCPVFLGCEVSVDSSAVRSWEWQDIHIPAYQWPAGTAFGNGLFVDVAFDPEGVAIEGERLRFRINPKTPRPTADAHSPHNYRSEIHTAPWNIEHPIGTEQWIGWQYTLGQNYVRDVTSPITIFQNHPGIRGLSPQIELELAGFNDPPPAAGGEIQVVNAANDDRQLLSLKPEAGSILNIVLHVVYGRGQEGLLQVWINDQLYYNKKGNTVYADHLFGGNNKWGIYHHTFNNAPEEVQQSLSAGAGIFDLYMGPLKMLTRAPSHPEYKTNAYHFVDPNR